jgi:hypothetical protein
MYGRKHKRKKRNPNQPLLHLQDNYGEYRE